jgi:hypothetical protein
MALRNRLLGVAAVAALVLGLGVVANTTPAQAAYGSFNTCYHAITTLGGEAFEREVYCRTVFDSHGAFLGIGIAYYDHDAALYDWSRSGSYGVLKNCYLAIDTAVASSDKEFWPACALFGSAYKIAFLIPR